MKYEIKCGFCGENFESSRSNAQFCSDNCRVKHHQSKKKQEETTVLQLTEEQKEQITQQTHYRQKIDELTQINRVILLKMRKASHNKQRYTHEIRELEIEARYSLLDIKDYEGKQKRFQQLLISKSNQAAHLKSQTKSQHRLTSLESSMNIKSIEKEIPAIEKEIEGLYTRISNEKRILIEINADLEMWKDRLNTVKNNIDKYRKAYEHYCREIDKINNRLNNASVTTSTITPLPTPVIPKRITPKPVTSGNNIGAADLQNIHFETFRLRGHLGAFLGELDRNKTSIALTGDSGAGKSWFSFEIVKLFINEMGFRVKYFSLEEGLGKLTQDKVAAFGLGNELVLAGTGSLEDVRSAAKNYPMVVVDSFNALNAKAEEFERLRTDFPNTLFLLIFQKTTAGTIRGGSAIKYNSSATINVIKRDNERIAIMEKGRYGTIGWEYSITRGKVIKSGDTY